MLAAFAHAMKTPDLRKKILFTLAMVAVYRLGATVPSPGVDFKIVTQCKTESGTGNDLWSMMNLFAGGGLLNLSVFALGIMPYITASIIVQLLTVVIPKFEELKKLGQAGQAKMTQYTRYLTIGLGILQSTAYIAMARAGSLFPSCSRGTEILRADWLTLITMVIVMTAGTAVIMWMGELITDRGIGNGMSILIFSSIASRIPAEGNNILRNSNGIVFTLVMLLGLAIIATVVFVEQAQRRIRVQYAKRMVGRRMYGGSNTYLPLKVNQAGVIPVIFATSLLYLPMLLINMTGAPTIDHETGQPTGGGWKLWLSKYVVDQGHWVHVVLYFSLIIFFTYFYVSITFNPNDRADDLKKYGGFIPGIRPGRPTAEYLQYVLSRITLPGSIYLGIVAILPNMFLSLTGSGNNQNFPFGGTAVLIMVGVGLDTVKQIESQLMQRSYEGFLK